MARLKILFGHILLLTLASGLFAQSDLVITGVIDGPLTGGTPKAIEFYVINNIPDLSIYGAGSANNGGGSDGEEFTFPSDAVTAGSFIYLATESTQFTSFLGFAPDYTNGSAPNINGDDAIELFMNGSVVDVFGDINLSGSGQPWHYQDGWAYRVDNTGPDGTTFTLANWSFSGANALDGELTNASAATPFPVGTYTRAGAGDTAPSVSSTTPANSDVNVAINSDIDITFSEAVTTSGSWFAISGASSGVHTAVVTGGPTSYTLNPDTDFANNETVTVTVYAASVADNDSDDPPDNMTADFVFTFNTINVTSTYEIYEIQSSGLASPYAGQTVTTENNVVTAVGPDGFAMQTPDARDDADPQTSNGIWVYTGGAPSVAVGDHVDVTGEVVEFFDLTEFSNSPSVSLVSAGNPLPAAIELDATTPSPNAPQSSTEYERFEGMLVHIAAGTVTSGNQRFGSDPIAEAFIVASATRPFREPGIAYPGLGGLPVWDGNPEVFELDPDRLGLANTYLVGGSTFEATGVIGYEYSDYELWPTSLSLSNVPTMPGEVRDETSNEITVGSLNVERLLSGASDYSVRLDKLSQFIRLTMKAPDIIAIQEVGGQTELDALAAEILADDAGLNYSTYFVGSNTSSDIFVGYLVRSDIPVSGVEELGAAETYTFGGSTSILHDRPPLKMVAQLAGGKNLTVLNVHLRSLNGIDDPSDGPRVRYKRDLAATSVSNMVQDLQTADPNINLIVLGDFNAFEFTDGYVDVLGQIIGDPADASEALIPGTEVVEPNLTNQVLSAAATNRYSYIYQGSAQVLDHILTSSAMSPYVTGLEFARGNADVGEEYRNDGGATALYSSDHDGVVLYINEDQLIPVELTTFAASAGDGFIELAWSTASESENMGFNVYRSESENGQYLKINEEIIAGQGNSASGASYSFQDSDVLSGNTYFYKIADVSFNGEITFHGPVSVNYTTTSVSNGAAELPSEFKLMQNYPNPFNPATTIGFALPEAADVTLRIYNVLGVEVRTLAENKAHNAGEITYTWDARNNDGQLLNSGVYYVRIETGTFTATKKMVYLR